MKSYSWDFGDGTTSTDSIVQHSYQEAGCYTPSFSFTTPDGCQTTVYVPECIKVNGPHNIDIWTSDDWVGCSESPGLPLFLNASSDIVGVRWEWHMGNMDTLQGKPIDYLYRTFGEYPVDLLVKYDNGCERTIPVDTAKLAPVLVNVWASTRSGCAPLQVDFRPQIQSLDSIISYKWEMDGRTYWEKEPTVLFARTGRYDIRLTVRTADGCEESLRLENYISIGEAVDIDFSADLLETCSDTSIAFSSQANGRVDKWLWQFGDSLTADVANPIHRYVDTGIFDVVLIAWQNGCPSTITKPQYIHIYPPIAKAAFEIDCNDPRLIQFTDNSLGAQTWEWDFGDGNTSTEQHPVHRYRRGGTYEVILTVVNRDYNCRDAVLTEVIVVDEEAEFELPKMKVCIGDSMRIENEAEYGARFEYIVPDGVELIQNGPEDATPLLRFPESGAFGPFSLLQTDVNGCMTRYTINDLVRVEEVVADFTADPTAGCPGVEVSFQSLSTSSEGRPLAHAWMFGQRGARSTEENPRQTFLGEDSYDIFLEVRSDEGCKDTEEKPDMILVNVPKAGFRSQLVDCDMNIIQFQSQSQGGRLSYFWTFGDGRTSTLSQPLHNYVDAGRYEVCLEVANSSSCLDKFCAFVDVDNLKTDFEADNTYKSCPTPPLLTTFRDLSLGAVAWEWDFGDGTAFSYIADPVHAYSEVGTYTVCLTSWDKDGCSETHCKENFIRVDGPEGMLSVSNDLGCAPLAVEFVAEVSPNTSVYVDFGNGAGEEIAQSGGRDVVQYDYLYEGLYIPVLILEDASGCRVSSLGEAIEVRELNIDFQLSQADFCQGDSIVIDFDLLLADDVSRYNFEWELPGSVQGSSNLAEPKGIQYEEVGLYDVILHVYSDDCSTSLYKREAVHVHPQVLPGVELPSQACAPVEFVVQVDTTAVSMNGLEWEWDLGNGQTSQAIAPFVRYDSVGTYVTRLYTRTQEGCVAERLDTIVVNEPPEALAGQAAPICLGDAVLLGSTFVPDTNWTIQWFPVDGLSCADCPSPVAQPDKTTRYHLEVTNEHGCLAVDSVEVVIRPFVHPQIDVLPDTSVCRGRQVQLSVLSDRPVWGHQWTDSYGSLSCYDCPQPVLLLDSSAYLSVQVRSEGDCLAVDSVFVEVFEQQANVLGEDRSICAGDSLLL
ncbi:MAG: PKD domain-containing protein, partial [Bacteroidota bacterium]